MNRTVKERLVRGVRNPLWFVEKMRLAALLLLVFVGGCHTVPPVLTETEIARIEVEVLASVEAAFEGRRQKELEMAMLPFHPTATAFAWGSVPRDYSGVRELTAERFEDLESWEGSFIDTAVRVLSREAAVFQGVYECTIEFPSGATWHYPGNASWTLLLEKTDDGWKITMGANASGSSQRIDEDESPTSQ